MKEKKHEVKRTRLCRDIRSSWFGPGLSQIWVPMPHTNFRSKIDFFVLNLIRCRDAWKDERNKHEMKLIRIRRNIRPSYFDPGVNQIYDRIARCRRSTDRIARWRRSTDSIARWRRSTDRIARCRRSVAQCLHSTDRIVPCRRSVDRISRC